jgi:multiple sugar transport system substrate-binding protein
VSWAFNEVVAGFYSGTCAMLDQDPDALIGIAQRMDKADFAVVPMPLGPAGKAFPTIGYAGWAMFHDTKDKEASWKLIAYLSNAKSNLEWAKFVGLIPTHKGADQDPYYHGDNFAGWFQELNDPKYELVLIPVHLQQLGQFVDLIAVTTGQELLLGKRTVQDVSNQWAKFLTDAQKQWLAQNKQ